MYNEPVLESLSVVQDVPNTLPSLWNSVSTSHSSLAGTTSDTDNGARKSYFLSAACALSAKCVLFERGVSETAQLGARASVLLAATAMRDGK